MRLSACGERFCYPFAFTGVIEICAGVIEICIRTNYECVLESLATSPREESLLSRDAPPLFWRQSSDGVQCKHRLIEECLLGLRVQVRTFDK